MRVTVDRILTLNPCSRYDRDGLEALFAGRKTASIAKALACEAVPVKDRLWLGIALLPGDRERRLFACWCAERVLPLFEKRYPEDKRPREAIKMAKRFAEGKATSEEELKAAADAADAPAAAADAAYAAAYAADAAAAAAAAYAAAAAAYAAYAADAPAAADAAAYAAYAADAPAAADAYAAAEREAQLEHLCDLCELLA